MHIAEITATEKIQECWELLMAHREELTTHKDLMVLKPDVARYKSFEQAGTLFSLALYDGDKIVGYSVTIVSPNIHYSDLLVAHNDIIYVHPGYRGGRWGLRLIHETEYAARKRGAKMMMFHGKKDTTFERLMPRLGYGIQDILFSKEI